MELGRITSSFSEVHSEDGSYILVKLDRERIQRMYLGVDADIVKKALIAAPKLKLKHKVPLRAPSLLQLTFASGRAD